MNSAHWRTGMFLLAAILLQSCGGDDGDGDNGGGDNRRRVTADRTTVVVAAEPGQNAPLEFVTLTVVNPPANGLHVQGEYSDEGIEYLDLSPSSATEATLQISFRLPGSLPDGTYEDQIQLQVCTDDDCTNEIDGSPIAIRTTYTVSGGIAATIDRSSIEKTIDGRDNNYSQEVVRITLDKPAEAPIYYWSDSTSNAVTQTWVNPTGDRTTEVSIHFNAGGNLRSGTFEDTITITACYDWSCQRQVNGSPFVITSRVSVTAGAEPGLDPLVVASRAGLTHNVIDAEFSKALNAVIMVGTYPVNALYAYDLATGEERQQLLVKVPVAVSVSPDGLTAAVGHDALISIVDLVQAGTVGAPAPTLLNVSSDIYDVVLDGNGFVHAFPLTDQWVNPHSIEIATNTETLGSWLLYAESRARLHPGGDWIYTADNGLSPSDIAKWDITSGAAERLYDSPYHGDHPMCGNLWYQEDGHTIYTACGATFRASASATQDMLYTGTLELSESSTYGWLIQSLSQSEAQDEIVLLEEEWYPCNIASQAGPCYTHYGVYESTFLNRTAIFSIGPVEVAGASYAQRGLFVFHDATGERRVLISRLEGMPDPDSEFYLSIVD